MVQMYDHTCVQGSGDGANKDAAKLDIAARKAAALAAGEGDSTVVTPAVRGGKKKGGGRL